MNFRKLKAPAKTILLSAAVAFGVLSAATVSSHIVFKDYLPISQAEDVADLLGCDFSYWQPNDMRMKHNNGEPIYVSISEDFSDVERQNIVDALNYVFGVMGDINPNYHYELVEDAGSIKYLNKSVVKFGVEQAKQEEADAVHTTDRANRIARLSGKGIFGTSNKIMFDPDYLKENEQENSLYGVTVHELLHCFGLDDVYCQEDGTYYGNSFLNPLIEDKGLVMITPNDYLALISIYAENFDKKSDKDDYVKVVNEFIDDYSKEYYTAHYNQRLQNCIDNGYSETRIEEFFAPVGENINLEFDGYDKNLGTTHSFVVNVKDGKYKISSFDENKNLIDEDTGKAFYVNGHIYLQDVRLNKCLNDKQSNIDAFIITDKLTGLYWLSDLGEIPLSVVGKEVPLELDNQSEPQK